MGQSEAQTQNCVEQYGPTYVQVYAELPIIRHGHELVVQHSLFPDRTADLQFGVLSRHWVPIWQQQTEKAGQGTAAEWEGMGCQTMDQLYGQEANHAKQDVCAHLYL